MVEGARLESVYRGDSIVGSNPTVSASSGQNAGSLARDQSLVFRRASFPGCDPVPPVAVRSVTDRVVHRDAEMDIRAERAGCRGARRDVAGTGLA